MSSMGGGSSGPTQQQQDLQTEQALTSAQLNLEENEQRKVILNAMQGTRAFRGSALTRAVASNASGAAAAPTAPAAPAPSGAQAYGALFSNNGSLLDESTATGANAVQSQSGVGTGRAGTGIGAGGGGGGATGGGK